MSPTVIITVAIIAPCRQEMLFLQTPIKSEIKSKRRNKRNPLLYTEGRERKSLIFIKQMSKLRLEGKVAIITGAASGIGEAAARLFASHGATIVIADIQDELGLSVAASIHNCSYRHCDVTDESQVADTVEHALKAHGRLDIMFSNAGIIGPLAGVLDLDLSTLDRTMAVNVRGTAAAIKHSARAMSAGGSIVCTASVASLIGGMGLAAYTASKHALVGLVRSAAAELGGRGIRVNCVSPFGVGTPMSCAATGMSAVEVEAVVSAASVLKGVVLKASHIAEAALFLASDESEFITGHNLVVDGGITVTQPPYYNQA